MDSQNGKQHEIHPGGARALSSLIEDYSLTMQHALRQDLEWKLKERALDEAGVLPPLTPVEMFQYLEDTDDGFYNWCFPFCAIKLTRSNLGYLHKAILEQFKQTLSASSSLEVKQDSSQLSQLVDHATN